MRQLIHPAMGYEPVDDLWVITCYFNPASYQSRLLNYQRFIASLHGLPHLTVECAFADQPFSLPAGPEVLQLRGGDVLWQKERLLNLAIERLPEQCTKIAWLDCDVLFSNGKWARETSALLDEFAVVQPFRKAYRLPRGRSFAQHEEALKSFAAVYQEDPARALRAGFKKHGHTGFAWAARRALLQRHGLFDTCLSGSGDHLIAHALCGDAESDCVGEVFSGNHAHHEQFRRWARGLFRDAQGSLSYTRGNLLHLWHGEHAHRQYAARNQELASLCFDPAADLELEASGLWRLARPDLQQWARSYFLLRKEDGYV